MMLEEMQQIKKLISPLLQAAAANVTHVAAPLDGPPAEAPNQAPKESDKGEVPNTDPSPPGPPGPPSSSNDPPNDGDAGGDDERGPPPPVLQLEDPANETLSGMIATIINLANANSYGLPATTNTVMNWVEANTGNNTLRYKGQKDRGSKDYRTSSSEREQDSAWRPLSERSFEHWS